MACLLLATFVKAQDYGIDHAHAHNDYLHEIPFYQAFGLGFGSIEVDVFLVNQELMVAHTPEEIKPTRTFQQLYLAPILKEISLHPAGIRPFQLLIDLKNNGGESLRLLQTQLAPFRTYFDRKNNPNAIQIVISGDRPAPSSWHSFDEIFYFDGRFNENYPTDVQWRVPLISDSFARYSRWNGLGKLPANEMTKVQNAIAKAHQQDKKVRFWGSPDTRTSYQTFIQLGVDWLGTDHLHQLSDYLQKRPANLVATHDSYALYQPSYKTDASPKKVKNIILLIGDGMGLAQQYAGFTANHGQLNLFQMRNIGLSKTNSADNYHTDSAAGATAIATGQKTNNRYIGVNTQGDSLATIPEILLTKGIKSGLVVSESITGATPASFYAHQPERSWDRFIFEDLCKSPIALSIGAGRSLLNDSLVQASKNNRLFFNTLQEIPAKIADKNISILVDEMAVRPKLKGRGNYLSEAFDKAVGYLKQSPKGFFLMLEGSQIDHGGHNNQLPFIVEEMLDFDQVIGKALAFADQDGETLVLVTADHETGGLTLHDGNFEQGKVEGAFATPDHTATPVMVFAYGPQAQRFAGFYENTAIFKKLLESLR